MGAGELAVGRVSGLKFDRPLHLYLEGLLSAAKRKNGWQLAEQIGDTRPWRTQRVLSHVLWDQKAARDQCRAYVLEHLGTDDGVLIVDETGFLKKGEHSVGVARQYSGTAGRIENAQIGVFLAYASSKGHALIDRELYLPRKEWCENSNRRAEAAIPEKVAFTTKPALAGCMIERALDAGLPCAWVLGDEVYGSDRRLRMALEQREQPFVLAIRSNEKLWAVLDGCLGQHAASRLAARLPAQAWRRLSAGAGSKGERVYDWARLRLTRLQQSPWDHWLLVRRSRKDPKDLAYYVVFGPDQTSLATLARVAGWRWAIEECFEYIAFDAKGGGEFVFGAVRGDLDCLYGPGEVRFTWQGFDEMDPVSGAGSAKLDRAGVLMGEIRFHLGDESTFKASRW